VTDVRSLGSVRPAGDVLRVPLHVDMTSDLDLLKVEIRGFHTAVDSDRCTCWSSIPKRNDYKTLILYSPMS
jgi:hypothetical protein